MNSPAVARPNTRVKHFAIVTRPGDNGEVYIQSATLTGLAEWPVAAQPSFPLAGPNGEGFFWTPQIGSLVEVEIDEADEHPTPVITRCLYNSDDAPNDKIKGLLKMGLASRLGHYLLFDVNPATAVLELGHPSGNVMTWDRQGNASLDVKASLAETVTGKITRTTKTVIAEEAKVKTVRKAPVQVYEGKRISLGSASSKEPVVLGQAFTTLYNAHQHIGNFGGPTSAPLVPMGPAHVSTKAFTEL